MSPGHRTIHAYRLLKRQIMTGQRPETERLDAARIARELEVSATPVRDALYQLFGERLIDGWPREGFRVPVLREEELAALYSWNGEVAGLLLRYVRSPPGLPPALPPYEADDPAEAARAVFDRLAVWLGSGEHQAALAQASDRLHRVRLAEPAVLPGTDEEIAAIIECHTPTRIGELRERLSEYHRRRQRHARQILAAMRSETPKNQ